MKKFFVATCACIGLSLFTMTSAFAQSSQCPYSQTEIEQMYNYLVRSQQKLISNPGVIAYRGQLVVINQQLEQIMNTSGCEYTQAFLSPALRQTQSALNYSEKYLNSLMDTLDDITNLVWE